MSGLTRSFAVVVKGKKRHVSNSSTSPSKPSLTLLRHQVHPRLDRIVDRHNGNRRVDLPVAVVAVRAAADPHHDQQLPPDHLIELRLHLLDAAEEGTSLRRPRRLLLLKEAADALRAGPLLLPLDRPDGHQYLPVRLVDGNVQLLGF